MKITGPPNAAHWADLIHANQNKTIEEKKEEVENTMEIREKRLISVKFENTTAATGKEYSYYSYHGDLVEGEYIIVPTRDTFSVAKFVRYITENDVNSVNGIKTMVQKIDFDEYNKEIEREKKIKEIQKKMEKRKTQLQERAIYEMMAKEDPSMKALLEEFDNLNK